MSDAAAALLMVRRQGARVPHSGELLPLPQLLIGEGVTAHRSGCNWGVYCGCLSGGIRDSDHTVSTKLLEILACSLYGTVNCNPIAPR